jgi:hypothetical protein
LGREWFFSSAQSTFTVERLSENTLRVGVGTWNLFVSAPGEELVQPGTYLNAVHIGTFGAQGAQLSLFGDGRSCNESIGRFDVLDIVYDNGGTVIKAAIDFEQACQPSGAKLHGQLRLGNDIPAS